MKTGKEAEMTTERSPLEVQAFLEEFPQRGAVGRPVRSRNHEAPLPGDQPANLPQTLPTGKQEGRTKGRCHSDIKEGLRGILQKLWSREILGKDHVELYLRDQYRRNLRVDTIRNSFTAIASFLALAKQGGKNHLEEIDRADLGAFIEHEQDRGLKASTVRNRHDTLKAFIRFLVEKEVVSPDVILKRMIIKVPDSLPKAMEIKDEAKMLSVINDVRDRAMILLLLRTGMRIGELLNAQVRDIHLEERKIDIWEAEKSRTGRVVYFTDDARDALGTWFEKRDPAKAFVFYARGRDAMTYAGARAMFCKYLRKANLSYKGYTLHCLRHTNASSLLNAGLPLECLRELLGHNSVEVTRRYAKLTNTTREKEYFKAMAKIERGEIDGYYKLDLELQKILEEEELLSSHGEKLHEQH
jgi:integrase/recombinase XerD